MSYDEMQQVWNEQPSKSTDVSEAREWVSKTRRGYLGKTAMVTVGIAAALIVIALKLTVIFNDPERTLVNSFFDFSVGIGLLLCSFFGLFQYVRERREFAAFGNDLTRCLDALIQGTRHEIRGMQRYIPLAYFGFLVLIVLSKFQSISAGQESPANAWGGVVFAIIIMIAASGFMYLRAEHFLKPQLQSLEKIRRVFD